MASTEDVQALRRMADEPGTGTYTDEALSALVDAKGGLDQAAASLWWDKAANYAKLVTTSESGSSRSMSDLHRNALTMAKSFEEKTQATATPTGSPFTQPSERQ